MTLSDLNRNPKLGPQNQKAPELTIAKAAFRLGRSPPRLGTHEGLRGFRALGN